MKYRYGLIVCIVGLLALSGCAFKLGAEKLDIDAKTARKAQSRPPVFQDVMASRGDRLLKKVVVS